jgi:hypothetical protein
VKPYASAYSLFINKDPGVIYAKGRKAMVDTKAAHTAFIASRPAAVQEMMFCEAVGDLVEQMEETCFYHANEAIYANTAALLVQGLVDEFGLSFK